ncbi:MAG: shikimate kinase [Deferribacteraceae bacterium]|nr:shikimate kinase [Deferribacteraceae bacterium]
MNIILIGFKASGKSSVGKLLAELLDFIYVDTDSLIEALFHKKDRLSLSCREIFELKGEEYFRDLETEVLKELNGLNNAVLSTGGGAVLREENKILLQELGKIIFLDVPLTALEKRIEKQNSPLFRKKVIPEIYMERYNIYLSLGERFVVDANNTPMQTARKIYNHIIRDIKSNENDEYDEDEDEDDENDDEYDDDGDEE